MEEAPLVQLRSYQNVCLGRLWSASNNIPNILAEIITSNTRMLFKMYFLSQLSSCMCSRQRRGAAICFRTGAKLLLATETGLRGRVQTCEEAEMRSLVRTLTQESLRKCKARKCFCPETLRENMSIIKFYFSLIVRISCFTSEIRSGSCPVTVLKLLFQL